MQSKVVKETLHDVHEHQHKKGDSRKDKEGNGHLYLQLETSWDLPKI